MSEECGNIATIIIVVVSTLITVFAVAHCALTARRFKSNARRLDRW